MEIKRIFVVGTPRSGTTYLQSLLNAHPQLVSFPETHFFYNLNNNNNFLFRKLSLIHSRNIKEVDLVDFNFPEKIVKYSTAVSKFTQSLDEKAASEGAIGWVEKTPIHLHYISLIEKYIPNAKFIHLIRNGVETVRSLYNVTHSYPEDWGGTRPLESCIQRWKYDLNISYKYREKKNHKILLYEQLVKEPKQELEALCSFLDLEFNEEMINKRVENSKDLLKQEEKWKAPIFDNKAKKQNFLKEEDEIYLRSALGNSNPSSLFS